MELDIAFYGMSFWSLINCSIESFDASFTCLNSSMLFLTWKITSEISWAWFWICCPKDCSSSLIEIFISIIISKVWTKLMEVKNNKRNKLNFIYSPSFHKSDQMRFYFELVWKTATSSVSNLVFVSRIIFA